MIPELQNLLSLFLCALPSWFAVRTFWFLFYRPRRKPNLLREILMAVFVALMASILIMALDGKWAAPDAMLRSAAERIRTGDRIHLQPFQTIGQHQISNPAAGQHAAVRTLGILSAAAVASVSFPRQDDRYGPAADADN